ncbi:MAG: FixH family protein, partial [Pseudomonadales bacterium]|nr:FixH family protein [Pseudomonadales bacterium]
ALTSVFQGQSSNVDRADFVHAGPFQVAVSVDPQTPQVGNNSILIVVRDQDGLSITGADVRAVAEMPAMGTMPAMYAQADIKETAPGVYQGDFEIPMAGKA